MTGLPEGYSSSLYDKFEYLCDKLKNPDYSPALTLLYSIWLVFLMVAYNL